MDYSFMRECAMGNIPLNEFAKGDKYDLYKKDAQEISRYLREAKNESDDKKSLALYKKALEGAKSLRKKAAAIPDEDLGDWLFNLCLKPWWWFVYDGVSAIGSGEGITGMSRDQAVRHYDNLIKKIEQAINALK